MIYFRNVCGEEHFWCRMLKRRLIVSTWRLVVLSRSDQSEGVIRRDKRLLTRFSSSWWLHSILEMKLYTPFLLRFWRSSRVYTSCLRPRPLPDYLMIEGISGPPAVSWTRERTLVGRCGRVRKFTLPYVVVVVNLRQGDWSWGRGIRRELVNTKPLL